MALTGLVVDWGGVLTASLDGAMAEWARTEDVDFAHFRDVMREWVGRRQVGPGLPSEIGQQQRVEQPVEQPVADLEQAPDVGPAGTSPVHRLERGELKPSDFEHVLAAELAARGSVVEPAGLLGRLLGGLVTLEDDMVGLVRRARSGGIRTALLSNSWGDHYPDELWDGLFDAVVISGRVGMRKPEPRIFAHTADLLGLSLNECVMVDDLPHNISAAVAAGMVGVLHRSYDETAGELEVLFDRPLR